MAEELKRKGDILYNILDYNIGSSVEYKKITNFIDNTPMVDANVDGVIYIKRASEYFKRQFDVITPEIFGAKGDGIVNDSVSLTKSIEVASKLKLPLKLENTYNLNNTTLTLPQNTILDFNNTGAFINATLIFNETTVLKNADNTTLKSRNITKTRYAKSSWIDWSVNLGDNSFGDYFELDLNSDLSLTSARAINLTNNNSYLYIKGNKRTITTNQFLVLRANNILIENANIILQSGANFTINNSVITKSDVTFKNCTFQNTEGNKTEMFYGIAYSSTPNPINLDFHITYDNCTFHNIPVHLANAGGITYTNCRSVQGANNETNFEQLHISNPLLKYALIQNSKFFANGFASDVIDCYNAPNIQIDHCYFEGYFPSANNEATFINVKSNGEQVGGLASDAIRTYNTKITNNTFKLIGFGYGIRLGNFVRDESIPILEKYKRLDVNILGNTFIFDSVVNPRGAIFQVGSSYNLDVSHNTMYIRNVPTNGTTYYFYSNSDASTTGDNTSNVLTIIGNKIIFDSENTNTFTFTFFNTDHLVYDAKVLANHIPSNGIAFNNRSRMINVIEIGNSFNRSIKGTTVGRPSLLSSDFGYLYMDSDLGKYILWNGSSWVNVNGSVL